MCVREAVGVCVCVRMCAMIKCMSAWCSITAKTTKNVHMRVCVCARVRVCGDILECRASRIFSNPSSSAYRDPGHIALLCSNKLAGHSNRDPLFEVCR